MKILIDSNILIYSLLKKSPYFETSRDILKKTESLFISSQNLIETYRVITSKQFQVEDVFTPNEANEILDIFSNNMNLVYPRRETLMILKNLFSKYEISSYDVYDANLVATMIDFGINYIYTNNDSDFKKYKEINVVNPFK